MATIPFIIKLSYSRREFKVDQPFLFYIYDHQNNIPLFVGRIVDPGGNLKLAKAEPIIQKAVAIPNCDESGVDASADKASMFLHLGLIIESNPILSSFYTFQVCLASSSN